MTVSMHERGYRMIVYIDTLDGIDERHLTGFFVGWPNPPPAATHLRLLAGSDAVVLAREEETGAIVGFVTAISDGVLSAYISYLEVLPEYQGQGIGSELMGRMLNRLAGLYLVCLTCNPTLQPFYERAGMRATAAMARYDDARQSGTESQ